MSIEDSLSQNTSFHFSQIEIHNVYSTLRNLDLKKCQRKLLTKILKLSAEIIAPSLTYIFSLSLLSGIYINECIFCASRNSNLSAYCIQNGHILTKMQDVY